MKLTAINVLSVASLPAIVLAQAHNPFHHRRQASAASSSASPASTSTSSTSSSGTPVSGSSSFTTPIFSTPTYSPSFSLLSQNPTAVPLSSIVVNASPAPTLANPPTAAPGSTPSNIPNAPGIPDISGLSPSKYPHLDLPPPTDSPEVQQWIKEVQASGVVIPNIPVNVAGGCPANPAAAANKSACWWTCGGCTRGNDVTTCPTKDTWGLTYDDGPSPYTPNLLDYLGQAKLLATFFVVGSRCISYPRILQNEYTSGNQIGVHTWSHSALTTQTNEQIIAELGWTKKIIKDVIGVTPTTMRPPYGDIDDRVRAICEAMQLTPVIWTRISAAATFDTGDFYIHSGNTSVQEVLYNWNNILKNASTINTGFIVLEHDLFQQSVEVATGYILPDALAHTQPSLTIEPVVKCLNLSPGDAYIETNDNASNPLPLASNGTFTNSTSSGSGQNSSNSGSGNTKSGALAGVLTNICGLTAAIVIGVLAIIL